MTIKTQGRCVVCENPLPDNAYFIYRDNRSTDFVENRVCDFACVQGAYFTTERGFPECAVCPTNSTCDPGNYFVISL